MTSKGVGRALVCGGNPGRWNWTERPDEEKFTTGVEAWVFALRCDYKPGIDFAAADQDSCDLLLLNLNPKSLAQFKKVLRRERRARVVGLFEGEPSALNQAWRLWSSVADKCDLIIAINGHAVSFLQTLTSTPVHHVGIPYPVDGVRSYYVPPAERRKEIMLCAMLLDRPNDYLAARGLGLPMVGFATTFKRSPRELVEHRSFDKLRYVREAAAMYDDAQLTILPRDYFDGYFRRAAQALLWLNLDPRYTWGRYILDAAALGVPVISTRETWHAPNLFPDLVVSTPYDIAGARERAQRLIDDHQFYQQVMEHAMKGLDSYRPENTVQRLLAALEP